MIGSKLPPMLFQTLVDLYGTPQVINLINTVTVVGQVFLPGAATAEVFSPGGKATEVFISGAVIGEVRP